MSQRKALFVQYTNPAAYPPLHHVARILCEQGWHCLFFGIGSWGGKEMSFPSLAGLEVLQWSFCNNRYQRPFHFLAYFVWSIFLAFRHRPSLIYCSDWWSCPIGLLLRRLGFSVVYHEHDAPTDLDTLSRRFFAWSRARLAQKTLSITPSGGRAELLRQLGACHTIVVPNYPSVREWPTIPIHEKSFEKLILVYQGSIVPDRPPLTLIEALANPLLEKRISWDIYGYETVGSSGYVERMLQLARSLGIEGLIRYHGTKPRQQMLEMGARGHIGVTLMPYQSQGINDISMVGASNKPFDYMMQGLALMVNDEPIWSTTFVESGYGFGVHPGKVDSIVSRLKWALDHPDTLRSMSQQARMKIRDDWNYEKCFLEAQSTICPSLR